MQRIGATEDESLIEAGAPMVGLILFAEGAVRISAIGESREAGRRAPSGSQHDHR
jgi:hypothetical protein